MNIINLARGLLAISFAIMMSTCAPPGDGRAFVGELGAYGPNVFVNNQAAHAGTWIYAGDSVTTGPASSAMIVFASGGYFQLDESTDPFFSWETIEGARCVLVRIFHGQGYVNGGSTCISSPTSDALAHSAVNIAVSADASVFTLLEGTLSVSRPGRVTLTPGQEVRSDAGAAEPRVRTLSPAEQQGRVAWRSRYQFLGWCGPAGQAVQIPLDQCARQFSFRPPTPPQPMPFPLIIPHFSPRPGGGDGGRRG